MVEMCPECGSIKVSLPRTTKEGRMTTVYYRCDECGHEWQEKRYR
jgi:DNA-directed RNA polymerase subunit M/transcription elongation factor TFIIS